MPTPLNCAVRGPYGRTYSSIGSIERVFGDSFENQGIERLDLVVDHSVLCALLK